MTDPDLAAALAALAEAEARAVQEFDIATGYMNERDTLASALAEIRRLCDEAEAHTPGLIGKVYTDEIRAALAPHPSVVQSSQEEKP